MSALTLHPFKQPKFLYNMELYLSRLRCEYLVKRQGELYHQLYEVNAIISSFTQFKEPEAKSQSITREDVPWEFMAYKESFSHGRDPVQPINGVKNAAIQDIIKRVVNPVSRFQYGYSKMIPLQGVQYKLRTSLQGTDGKQVRDELSHVVQYYGPVEIVDEMVKDIDAASASSRINIVIMQDMELVKLKEYLSSSLLLNSLSNLHHIETTLTILRTQQKDLDVSNEMLNLEKSFPQHSFIFSESGSSYGQQLLHVLGHFQNEDLLFFIRPQTYFTEQTLLQVQQNTVQSKQVYFPVIYKQYNGTWPCHTLGCVHRDPIQEKTFLEASDYEQFSVYKSDLEHVMATLQGRGSKVMSVNELIDGALFQGFNVFRSPDPYMKRVCRSHDCYLDYISSHHLTEIAYNQTEMLKRGEEES